MPKISVCHGDCLAARAVRTSEGRHSTLDAASEYYCDEKGYDEREVEAKVERFLSTSGRAPRRDRRHITSQWLGRPR